MKPPTKIQPYKADEDSAGRHIATTSVLHTLLLLPAGCVVASKRKFRTSFAYCLRRSTSETLQIVAAEVLPSVCDAPGVVAPAGHSEFARIP